MKCVDCNNEQTFIADTRPDYFQWECPECGWYHRVPRKAFYDSPEVKAAAEFNTERFKVNIDE